MRFIKPLSRVGLIMLLLMATGCQYMPDLPDLPSLPAVLGGGDSKTEQSSKQSAAGGEAEEPVVIRTPNPYLEQRVSVPKDAQQRFATAKQAMYDKKWSQAQFELEWLIKNFPTLSGPHLNMALLYRELKQPNKAEVAFQKAIAANPKNINALNQYGVFLREQGRFKEAEANYRKALDVWPDHPESHRNLGILYDLYMGKVADALPFYQRYQELLDKPDRRIAGWIADTKRRVKQTGQTQ